uniref:Uncharacterized protein n=1 Tax=Anas platyrhynchos platyrhynchos TaxID=8840 RepID=A0A493T8W0_ANAPP
MAEERGMAMVTCTAPVNIAVIKYCSIACCAKLCQGVPSHAKSCRA